ncbi:hypothetical protein [Nitrosomonas sp.]|uniref:hypothetical protein n=1 Tax=Nitrosomonas sp. TaxID=42353 RepID=UPI001DCFAE64|nr:hypothetical protein [Nitrosomonas sp.]MBX3617855.1 hypothetical protein [Nitrosomonas sp.]
MAANVSFQLSGYPDNIAQYPAAAVLPQAGAIISNLKGASQTHRPHVGLGTLGFFAAKKGASNWQSLVLVSNRHVLAAHEAKCGDMIFQPGYEEKNDQAVFDTSRLNAIAKIDNIGLCGHFSYAYPGEIQKPYFIDCATASLLFKQNNHTQRNHDKTRHFTRVARVHPHDTFEGRELKVRIAGRDVAWGKIIDCEATVETITGEQCRNTLVIRAIPDQYGKLKPFSRKGDSGALLIDQYQRAVGLLWGNHTLDPYVSYACHIHPVLSFLQIIPWCFNFCAPQSDRKD